MLAQPRDDDVASLIKKLSSANFQERQAADKALRNRPEAAAALRGAMPSFDLETRRRAAEILRYYDLEPVRELNAAVKNGHVLHVAKLIGSWKKEEFEAESWNAVCDLARILHGLHEKQGGEKIKLMQELGKVTPVVISGKRIDVATKRPFQVLQFVRGGEVDMVNPNYKGATPQVWRALVSDAVVAAGPMRLGIQSGASQIVIAGGNIELDGEVQSCIIISGGDITFRSWCYSSLVIARGKVTGTDGFAANRVIAGKKVRHSSKQPNLITENDLNPLGFIRWTDAPKKQAAPESKR